MAEGYKPKYSELSKLIKASKVNKKIFQKEFLGAAFSGIGVFIAAWQLPDIIVGVNVSEIIKGFFTYEGASINQGVLYLIILIVFALICLIIFCVSYVVKKFQFKKYLNKKVDPGTKDGSFLEVTVADSYLTNAFVNYPDCDMIVGINSAFIFEQSQKKSLIYDMCEMFKKDGFTEEDIHKIQEKIDDELFKLKQKDSSVVVRKKGEPKASKPDEVYDRDVFKIGTIVSVDIDLKKNKRKLSLMANSNIDSIGKGNSNMHVQHDTKNSVVENYDRIWEYFRNDPAKTGNALLMPLIGAGVAKEDYSDIEIFAKIVDLYFEDIQRKEDTAIKKLIINIRNTTAIKCEDNSDPLRSIDIQSAYSYMDFRNRVKAISNHNK